MAKHKFRTLEELYGVSEEVSQPKITPVLKGGYRIQGPADDAESVIQLTMGSCGTEKGFSGHFSSGKLNTRAESGICNVCATLCSSCMHFDRVASLVGKMTEFSDEGCQEKIASRCFFNDAELLSPCKSNASDDQQHTSSETSNLLSGCSSHESFSENAESKVILRASHTSEDIEMGQPLAEDSGLPNPSTFHGNIIFSNQHKNQNDLECPGDDISCISRADGPVGDHNGEGDRKNVSYSSASVNSSPIAVATVNVEPTSHCLVSSHRGEELELKSEFTKESMRKTAGLSNKLDPSEISYLRGVYAGPSPTSRKGEPSECSGKQVESSSARVAVATSSFGGQMPDKKEHSEKSCALLETSSAQKGPLQSQLVDDNVKSDVLEYEVKVCDICGDAGLEELLATCTKCSDGAEHIYCMRIKLEKVPGRGWMCEECMAKEETQKEMKCTIGFLKGSSLNQTRKNSGNSSTSKFENFLEFESMDSTVSRSRTKSLDSAPQFSAKRPADSLETVPVTKKRTLETLTRPTKVPSPHKKDILSRDSSFRNLCKGKVKQAHETSFGDNSSNNTLQSACLPTVSDYKSQKIPQQLQMSRGSLLKSNSFHILDANLKVKLPEKAVLQKQKFTRETDTSDMKKGIGRMMSKSLSFNGVGSKHLNVAQSKVKMFSSNFSHVEDLKRLRHAKQNSLQRDHKSKSYNPHMISPVAGSGDSAPTTDKKTASRGETVLAHSSGTTCNELRSMQFHRNSNNSSEPTSRLAPKDLKCSHGQGVSGAKRSALCLSDVDKDPSPRMSDSSHEPKLNRGIPEVVLTSSSSLTINRHNCNPGAILQDQSSQTGKSSNQEEQSRVICSFSQPRLKISVGSRSAHCHRCKGIGHSRESCPTMSSQVPILDAGNSKEVNKSSKMGDVAKADIVGKDELHKRSRCPNQSDELSMSSSNVNSKVSSSDYLSRHSSWLVNLFSADETNGQQIRVAKDVRWHVEHNTQAANMIKVENSNSVVPSDERLYVRDVPRLASTVSFPSRISAVPELDYIWQGGFEVHRIGRLSSHYTGIQAHLSTCASPKVLEVVHMLPPKIILEEVPRLSTWPAQFMENYATEDNIALYFFAADLESYGRNYKSLLEWMIKNDLALKGNLKGIELLIFSSKLLPEKSQRWNALSFLWGVFRVRRVNNSEHVPTSHIQVSVPCLNILPSDQDLSITTSGQLFESRSATNVAPQELRCINSGRTSFDQKPSRVNTISCSSAPIGEQFSNDMLQTNISLNEHRGCEGRVEVDPKLCLQARGEHRSEGMKVEEKTECERAQSDFCGMYEYNTARDAKYLGNGYPSGVSDPHCSFPVEDQRCQGAHKIEISEKLKMTGGSAFSASGSVDLGLGVKFSQQQVPSIDGEDQAKSGYPNLELSLGAEKKPTKQEMAPSFLGIVNKKSNQDKRQNPESNRKNSDEELSLSLSLGLSFPDRTNARA